MAPGMATLRPLSMLGGALMLLLLLCGETATAFYLPGVAPHDFAEVCFESLHSMHLFFL